jgi:hypothetical protein
MKNRLLQAAAVLAFAGFASFAAADAIIESGTGNECGSGGLENCEFLGSPIIAKYNYDDQTFDFLFEQGAFASIDGTEFTLTCDNDECTTGSWTYNPGAGDPGVVYYIVSAGNQWDAYLNEAPLLSGAWSTPTGPGGQQAALSHISFFDTEIPREVAEPASLLLVGLGLVAAGLARRRRI